MGERSGASWRVEVVVVPKRGVNDPEGQSILGGLRGLGYEAVSQVRAGRIFHLLVDAPDATAARRVVVEMCDRLLANPVIETYDVRLVDAGGAALESQAPGERSAEGVG